MSAQVPKISLQDMQPALSPEEQSRFAPLIELENLSGFRITRHQLMLFGLCPTCRSEKDR